MSQALKTSLWEGKNWSNKGEKEGESVPSTGWGREILAGIVTFTTMSYILCVQPSLLSGGMLGTPTGADAGALLTTTCLVSAFASILMGVWAKYPFALAPGMGENFFVVTGILPLCVGISGGQTGDPAAWSMAIGTVLIAGLLFLAISLTGFRTFLITAISPSLKMALGVGIGLFIASLGMKNAGLFLIDGGQLRLGSLHSPDFMIFLVGFLVISILSIRKIPGAVLFGILVSTLLGIALGKVSFHGIFGLPANPAPVLGKLDLLSVMKNLPVLLPSILILCFMDLFDTFGTVVGVGEKSGMMVGGTLPRSGRVFTCDALATVVGALGGHSTVTTFAESAAGIACGGRTGRTAVVVGVLFLLSLFLSPLVMAIGSYPPVTACALIFVGMLMTQGIGKIDWSDMTESIPAFFVIVGIPFTQSIGDGIMFGLILWPWLKLFAGSRKEVHPALYLLSIFLTIYAVMILK